MEKFSPSIVVVERNLGCRVLVLHRQEGTLLTNFHVLFPPQGIVTSPLLPHIAVTGLYRHCTELQIGRRKILMLFGPITRAKSEASPFFNEEVFQHFVDVYGTLQKLAACDFQGTRAYSSLVVALHLYALTSTDGWNNGSWCVSNLDLVRRSVI